MAVNSADDAQVSVGVTSMKVEGRVAPMGIDVANPTFSWRVESDDRGWYQKAYRIMVMDSSGSVVWDSGEVESSLQNNIEYGGMPLKSREIYNWEVWVTGIDNRTWTARSRFETSFMSADEWRAI